MSDVLSVDPRTGQARERVAAESTPQDVDRAVRAAAAAAPALADRSVRADLLRTAAALLEEGGEEIIATADAETALGRVRLTGELARTCYQLRAFADVAESGAFLDVIIDHADPAARPAPAPTCGATRCRWAWSRCSRRATSRWPSACRAATPPARWPPAARSSSRRIRTIRRPAS
ncbi:aldehyde dehydrogenase family protein [Actinomadura sp. ATCC 39365]